MISSFSTPVELPHILNPKFRVILLARWGLCLLGLPFQPPFLPLFPQVPFTLVELPLGSISQFCAFTCRFHYTPILGLAGHLQCLPLLLRYVLQAFKNVGTIFSSRTVQILALI